MANTGKTNTPVQPGRRKTGAHVVAVPEASAQTYPKGAILVRTSGYVQSSTGACLSVNLFGIALKSGQNGASDGAKTASVYRFRDNEPFKATFAGTWTDTLRGATAAISVNSVGVVQLKTGTAVSASSCCVMQDVTPEFAIGDANPTVYFVPFDSAIQS